MSQCHITLRDDGEADGDACDTVRHGVIQIVLRQPGNYGKFRCDRVRGTTFCTFGKIIITFGYLRSYSSSSCLSRNLSPVHLWESLLYKEVICDHYQLFHLPLDFLMPLIIPPTALLWNDCVGETEHWLTYHTYFGAGLTACNLNNKTHTTYTYTYSPHTTRYINIAHTLHSSSLYCHTSLGQTTDWPHEYTYFLALTLSDLIFSTAHKGKV